MTERRFSRMIRARARRCQVSPPAPGFPPECAVYSRRHGHLAISLPRLEDHIETLSTFGTQPDGQGITRSCWSPAHEEARAWLLGRMKAAGLETWVDAAGNTFGMLPGDGRRRSSRARTSTPCPRAGPLDGALGVLAGLECLQTVKEARPAPRGGRSRWWRGATRRAATAASSARGPSPASSTSRRSPACARVDGERLVDAMARAGYNATRRAGGALRPDAPCTPTSSCTSSRARTSSGAHPHRRSSRASWASAGTGSPSSASPTTRAPPRWRGARTPSWPPAEYALKAREHIVRKGSGRSVTNFGRIELAPGVSNIVPGRGRCCCRRCASSTRGSSPGSTASAWPWPARSRGGGGLRVVVDTLSRTEPARCAPRVMRAVQAACDALRLAHQADALGRRPRRAESRPGHGLRHALHPLPGRAQPPAGRDERLGAIERGTNALLHTLLRLAG